MGRLNGKFALITGGTTGIGLATARLFRDEGARVAVTGRSEPALSQAAKELGSNVLVLKSDAARLSDVDALMATLKQKFGRLDVLFANAGGAKFKPMTDVDEADFDWHFSTNVKGLFFTVQKALSLLATGGSVILNASVAGRSGMPNSSVYSASKAAVRSFGRTMAAELAPRNIRVNTISPGPITTPIFGKLGLSETAAADFREMATQMVALHRFGEPEEIARTALFLASDDSSFMVAAELVVDGGLSDL